MCSWFSCWFLLLPAGNSANQALSPTANYLRDKNCPEPVVCHVTNNTQGITSWEYHTWRESTTRVKVVVSICGVLNCLSPFFVGSAQCRGAAHSLCRLGCVQGMLQGWEDASPIHTGCTKGLPHRVSGTAAVELNRAAWQCSSPLSTV